MENNSNEPLEKGNRGAHNLVVLGIGSVIIALATSLISLYLYHSSGDIYLDCSLPGADCPSARASSDDNNREKVYVFSDSGDINTTVINEYLQEIEKTTERINNTIEALDSDVLTNESLGI